MDENVLIVLRADVVGQMDLIDGVFTKLNARTADLHPDDEAQLESVAYQLHNLYSAVEDLFKLIASQFENQVSDASRWHIELLQRMKQEIPGVRPALISQETFNLLNGLRSFRHFFRHAYTAPIEFNHLQINLEKAKLVYPSLHHDVKLFLEQIGI